MPADLTEKVEQLGDAASKASVVWGRVLGYPFWPAQSLPIGAIQRHPQLLAAKRKKNQVHAIMYFGSSEFGWVSDNDLADWATGIQRKYHKQTKWAKKFAESLEQVIAFLTLRQAPKGWWCPAPAGTPLATGLTPQTNLPSTTPLPVEASTPVTLAVGKEHPQPAAGEQSAELAVSVQEKDPSQPIAVRLPRQEPAQLLSRHRSLPVDQSANQSCSTGHQKRNREGTDQAAEPSAPVIDNRPAKRQAVADGAGRPQQPPRYDAISRLLYRPGAKFKRQSKEDVQVCNCRPPSRYASLHRMGQGSPSVSCGQYCLNRQSFILCDPKSCPCGDHCANRPFHQLRSPAVEVYMTGDCGWGLKAAQDIRRGSYVMEYLGEVIGLEEYRARLQESKAKGEVNFYMMQLAPGLIIDANRKGNLTRFVNHSCQPNCDAQKWTDAATGEIRVALFANQDIPSGGQLTYDYKFEHAGMADLASEFKCKCGAANCRGTIDTVAQKKYRDWNRRIEVQQEDGTWQAGVVTTYNNVSKKHNVRYDTGKSQKLSLQQHKYRWLDGGPDTVGPPSAKKPTPVPPKKQAAKMAARAAAAAAAASRVTAPLADAQPQQPQGVPEKQDGVLQELRNPPAPTSTASTHSTPTKRTGPTTQQLQDSSATAANGQGTVAELTRQPTVQTGCLPEPMPMKPLPLAPETLVQTAITTGTSTGSGVQEGTGTIPALAERPVIECTSPAKQRKALAHGLDSLWHSPFGMSPYRPGLRAPVNAVSQLHGVSPAHSLQMSDYQQHLASPPHFPELPLHLQLGDIPPLNTQLCPVPPLDLGIFGNQAAPPAKLLPAVLAAGISVGDVGVSAADKHRGNAAAEQNGAAGPAHKAGAQEHAMFAAEPDYGWGNDMHEGLQPEAMFGLAGL